jgi:hypothetical protein
MHRPLWRKPNERGPKAVVAADIPGIFRRRMDDAVVAIAAADGERLDRDQVRSSVHRLAARRRLRSR